ncbi:MAG: YbaK/EbsC family protein [Erysipelotrichaceae bacterium]|nr:YbaK/EbsC family protein [Erysipelotrichaceae bacterium]
MFGTIGTVVNMNNNREKVEKLLKELQIEYTVEDTPVMTIEQAKQYPLQHREAASKSLLLIDKKAAVFCVTVFEDKRVDLKRLKELLGCSRLSFVNSQQALDLFGYQVGISPLGVINDKTNAVTVVIDEYFKDKLIMIHPNSEKATMWLKCQDLVEVISKVGNKVMYLDL